MDPLVKGEDGVREPERRVDGVLCEVCQCLLPGLNQVNEMR